MNNICARLDVIAYIFKLFVQQIVILYVHCYYMDQARCLIKYIHMVEHLKDYENIFLPGGYTNLSHNALLGGPGNFILGFLTYPRNCWLHHCL